MARNYAVLLHDYLEEMEPLSDEEFGRLCRALLKYSRDGEDTELIGNERMLWPRAKTQENKFQANYEEMRSTKRSAGKKGAAARWHSYGKDTTSHFDDGKDGEYGKTKTETKTEINSSPPNGGRTKRAVRFTPPTLAEVQSYVAERHSPVDPQEFIDFYESKGWMVGKTPMKDWKAACRNAENWDRWSRKEPSRGGIPACSKKSWAELARQMDEEDSL